ncbi:tetratricopeptide repeat protein [Microcoleus vaginatus PCC 9802]|uniref:tetratricopeptide repeat protein n=1 Tax=Microcoleus vaginatus TaxID=119532 RepID=UPI00020D1D5B|nr:Tetratricopeptide TPR_1 repeat-containing protein [Microcoleus vaginatus FGP-2]UNU18856.1 tetratricopeptide repeat protein [Microcoleus vaginatus PCC 9802]
MLNKIWQFFKRLIQRILGTQTPPTPPENTTIRPTLTDAEYESKFMEILEGVNAGWSRGDVAGFLIAKRLKDGELAAWLRRFGKRLLEGEHDDTAATDAVASLQELAQRLVLLGRIGSGELSEVARQIGREILTRFPLPEVEEEDTKGKVIEAVFVGDGLGFSGEVNRRGAEGAEAESEVNIEAEAWCDRGNEQYNLGRFEEAIASYNQAIALKPDYHDALHNREVAQRKLGEIK